MDCSDCGRPIEEGRHCVVWGSTSTRVVVRFVCESCSNKPEYREIDPTEDDSDL